MASLSERLAYVLTFDTTSGVKSLNKFGDAADKELSKASKQSEALTANFAKFGAAAVAFAGVAGVGLAKLAIGASEARQNFQALEQVVGATAAVEIKDWADGAAQSIGTSSRKAVEAATSFAQLGKLVGLGGEDLSGFSTDLVGLAADFAAFKNVNPEQALQDIRSGFSGSVEVMRKYGIFLTEGILKNRLFEMTGKRVTGTLSAQDRILATNAELYSQGADMIGQFEREQSSLVGQTSILKAELTNLGDSVGAGVLPVMRSAVTGLGALAEAAGNVNPAIAQATGFVAASATALVGASGGALLAASGLRKVGVEYRKLGTVAQSATIATGLVSAALVAAAYAYDLAGRAKREQTAATNAYVDALKAEKAGIEGANEARLIELLTTTELAGATDDLGLTVADLVAYINGESVPALDTLSESAGEVDGALRLGGFNIATGGLWRMLTGTDAAEEAKKNLIATLDKERIAARLGSEQIEDMAAAERDLAASEVDWARSVGFTVYELDEQTGALKATGSEVREVDGAIKDLTPTIEHLDRNVKGLTQSYDDNVTALRDARRATRDAASGAWDAADAQDGFYDALENIDEVLKDVESSERDVAKSYRDGARATDEMIVAQLEAEGVLLDTERGQRAWNDAMVDSAVFMGGPLGAEILAHIGRVNDIPEEKITQIQAALDRGQVDTARRLIEAELSKAEASVGVTPTGLEAARARIEAILGRSITIRTETGGYTPQVGGSREPNVPPNTLHDGGPVTANMAGAGGPGLRYDEVPAVLQTGEYVMSREDVQSASQGGAGGVTVQLVGDIYGVPSEEFVAELAGKLNKYAAGMA